MDVAAVRRDDALIDAIAGGGPVATDSPEQYELALLLANWRADIVATPMPDGPLLDDVIAAMDEADAREARSAARGKLRLLRPIAGAAAAIAVVMGGATIFSYNAEPGDPLWSVKSVVFSQQADSTVAQIDTTSQLQEAERMLATGDAESVKNLLDNAADRVGGIRDADQRRELEVWRAKLAAQLAEIAPTTTAQAPAPGTTTTDAPALTTQLPTSLPGLPGTTLPGVEPQPGTTLPSTDLQLPGLPRFHCRSCLNCRRPSLRRPRRSIRRSCGFPHSRRTISRLLCRRRSNSSSRRCPCPPRPPSRCFRPHQLTWCAVTGAHNCGPTLRVSGHSCVYG